MRMKGDTLEAGTFLGANLHIFAKTKGKATRQEEPRELLKLRRIFHQSFTIWLEDNGSRMILFLFGMERRLALAGSLAKCIFF